MNTAIVQRELASVRNNRWVAAMVWLSTTALCGFALLRWPDDQQADIAGTQSESLFRTLAYALLALVLLLAPSFPAMSIVRDRRGGALALLLDSPLQPHVIYINKFLAALAVTLLPLTLSLPAAVACFVMGGVDLVNDLAALYATLALAAVQVVSIGLWVSVSAATLDGALRWTYAATIAVCVLSVAPQMFLHDRPADAVTVLATAVSRISPIVAVEAVAGASGRLGPPTSAAGEALTWYAIAAIGMAALLAWRTTSRLRPTMFDRARASTDRTSPQSPVRRRFRRAMFLVDPDRPSRPIVDWVNPVMIKEFRTRRFGRSQWLLRLVAGCALLSLLLTYAASAGAVTVGVERIGGVLVTLQAALILAITPALASGLISVERETGGWALLCNTPLSAGRIVRGKLASVSFTVALILLATLPGYAVMMVIQPVLQQQVIEVLISLVLTAVAAVCFSTAISSLFRRTTVATIVAYGALATVCGGSFLIWTARDAPFGHAIVERALSVNPIAAALQVLDFPGFETYRLVPAAWIVAGAVAAVSVLSLWIRTISLLRPE